MASGRRVAIFNAVVGATIFLGVIVLGYVLSQRRFVRADLTTDRIYTLTEASKRVMADLKDLLIIRCYFSEKLPKAVKPQVDWINDLLTEYAAFGRGNVRIETLDPGSKELSQAEKDNIEQGFGVHAVTLQEQQRDQVLAMNCYLSIVLLCRDKHERIDLLDPKEQILDPNQSVVGLEYALARRILRVSQEELKGVGLIAETPPPPKNKPPNQDSGSGWKKLNEELERQYRIQPVSLKRGSQVPDGLETLIVAQPKNLTEREAFEIDQFVMKGGKLMVFADRFEADLTQGVRVTPIKTGLEGVLENWGFKLDPTMMAEGPRRSGVVVRQQQQGFLTVQTPIPYPYFVLVSQDGIDSESPVVSRLKILQFPWVSPIELLEDRLQGKEVVRLARSSADSWTATDAPFVERPPESAPSGSETGSRVLAAAAVGKFSSAFAGKPVPKPEDAEADAHKERPDMPDLAEEIAKRDAERQVLLESPETRVLVVGSSTLLNDTFVADPRRASGLSDPFGILAMTFLLNATDWFTLGDPLIQIRSRGFQDQRLKEIEESTKELVRWSNVLGIPVLLVVFWILRSVYRRRSAARYLPAGSLSR